MPASFVKRIATYFFPGQPPDMADFLQWGKDVEAVCDISTRGPLYSSDPSPHLSPLQGDGWTDPADGTIYQYVNLGSHVAWYQIDGGTKGDGTQPTLPDGSIPFSGPVAMSSNKITALADGTIATDAVTLGQLTTEATSRATADALLVPISSIVDGTTSSAANVPLSANQGRVLANALAAEVANRATAEALLVPIASIINVLTSTATNVPLSAAQGKALAALITAEAATRASQDALLVTTASIVNDLTTGGTTVPLSAEQGKVLNTLVMTGVGTTTEYATIAARNAASNINNGDGAWVDDNGSGNWELFFRVGGVWKSLLSQTSISGTVAGSVQKDGSTTMTGALPMGGNKITNVAVGTLATDAVALSQLTSEASTARAAELTAQTTANAALPKAGGTMSGPIAMSNKKITGLANGTASTDVAAFGQIPVVAIATPLPDADIGVIGASGRFADEAHVHPKALMTDCISGTIVTPTNGLLMIAIQTYFVGKLQKLTCWTSTGSVTVQVMVSGVNVGPSAVASPSQATSALGATAFIATDWIGVVLSGVSGVAQLNFAIQIDRNA